jgi:hypothetical protein
MPVAADDIIAGTSESRMAPFSLKNKTGAPSAFPGFSFLKHLIIAAPESFHIYQKIGFIFTL